MGHNTEIYDCTVCCNPNKLSYEVYDGEINSLTISDGNEQSLFPNTQSAKSIPMRSPTTTLCLTFALLLGSVGMSQSADFREGLTLYMSGDYATSLREWKPLADKNDARAQSLLGFIYRMGQGNPVNPIVATEWYTLSAAQGAACEQFSLGMMYLQGIGGHETYNWQKICSLSLRNREMPMLKTIQD